MYQIIFFDLDGTLTDSGRGITNSVRYALEKYGITEPAQETLMRFVGPPLLDSFQKYFGFDPEKAKEAVAFYREYFSVTGIYENEVYPGVRELLERTKASGRKVVLATAKPEHFAKIVLEHFDLSKYFDFVAGCTLDEKRSKKSEVIAYALEQLGITDLSQVVMVGDREDDANGAEENGLDCIGVLYGYGSREELANAGIIQFAESPADVFELL